MINCHGDQLLSFFQLIGRSCHHFVHLFGKSSSLLSMSEEISSYRHLKGVVIKALKVASYRVANWKTQLIGYAVLM